MIYVEPKWIRMSGVQLPGHSAETEFSQGSLRKNGAIASAARVDPYNKRVLRVSYHSLASRCVSGNQFCKRADQELIKE